MKIESNEKVNDARLTTYFYQKFQSTQSVAALFYWRSRKKQHFSLYYTLEKLIQHILL